jgi:hypothetical protein
MPPKSTAGAKTYDEITVLGLLLCIKNLGGSYNKVLADMSAIDGERSVSSFEHSLRSANKLAGELFTKQKAGQKLGPADIGRTVDVMGGGTPKKRAAVAGDDGGSARKKRTTVKKEAKLVDSGIDGMSV